MPRIPVAIPMDAHGHTQFRVYKVTWTPPEGDATPAQTYIGSTARPLHVRLCGHLQLHGVGTAVQQWFVAHPDRTRFTIEELQLLDLSGLQSAAERRNAARAAEQAAIAAHAPTLNRNRAHVPPENRAEQRRAQIDAWFAVPENKARARAITKAWFATRRENAQQELVHRAFEHVRAKNGEPVWVDLKINNTVFDFQLAIPAGENDPQRADEEFEAALFAQVGRGGASARVQSIRLHKIVNHILTK